MFLFYKDLLSFVLENMQPTNMEDWEEKKKKKVPFLNDSLYSSVLVWMYIRE